MKYFINFCRIFIGVLFIFSGAIKLNDPIGFAFKLEEYFSPRVFDIAFLKNLALPIAIFVAMYELIVGLLLLLGYKVRIALKHLIGITVFFGFLTFYSAYFNKVTDCGCFGDAIKLTPWQSFWKDILFLVLILVIFFNQKYLKPLFTKKIANYILLLFLVVCFITCYKSIHYLPTIDFRPYKVNTNIPENMKTPEDAPVDEFEIIWIYEVDGQKKEFSDEDEPWNIEGAKFIDRKTKLIKKGYTPPIQDFIIKKGDSDFTDIFLDKDKLLLVIAYNLSKSEEEGMQEVLQLKKDLISKGIECIGLSASIETPKIPINFYFCDETTLKTIIRSNPGVVLLKKGTIVGKWSWRQIPSSREMDKILQ